MISTSVQPLAVRPPFLLGVPNQITLFRTVIAMVIAAFAFRTGMLSWLTIGYAAYWLGDMADGAVARYRKEESVAGAVFDIVCDRACSFLLAAAFMATFPATIGPLAIFLVQFGVLDTMLSLAFLLWPGTLSPNYFYKVDRPIWIWNWSKPAKAVNSSLFAVLLLVTGWVWLGAAIATALLVMKTASLVRLGRIGLPIPAR